MIARTAAIFLACLSLSCLATEEGLLRDPTRPPDALPVNAGAGNEVALRLDAVLRPAQGKPAAVINGETVKLGGEINGMRLTAVREAEVVLRGPQGSETLRLAPEVSKTIRQNGPAATGNRKRAGSGS